MATLSEREVVQKKHCSLQSLTRAITLATRPTFVEKTMPSSSDDNATPLPGTVVDLEIASLLTAIEREKVPDRLTKLAVELQNALVEKRQRETGN
ncbi:MAG: hypothetical protein E5W21_04605 [Mesorhizobium sp.]|nr:MAG: hypothetical protein E5W21_04605 [Mesorhizobium sp.]